MLSRPSQVNPWNIEFYEEPKMIEVPLWEFSKTQLETRKERLTSELVTVNEMLTYFTD